ncbi:MAG: hypothetical protein QOD35_2180 [Nocardioidaceae bacterium]|nr:hypothetical protein [Nocardioidaceae bacterium]
MTALDAIQQCLAAEHAAVYGYGVVGGVLADLAGAADLRTYAQDCYDAHRAQRDALTALLARNGQTPVAAHPAYRLPGPVVGSSGCRALARQIERRSAAVYAFAVSKTSNGSRAMAVDALTDCALRETGWGAEPRAFPGVQP